MSYLSEASKAWDNEAKLDSLINERSLAISERQRKSMTQADLLDSLESGSPYFWQQLIEQCRDREYFEIGLSICGAIKSYCDSLADQKAIKEIEAEREQAD